MQALEQNKKQEQQSRWTAECVRLLTEWWARNWTLHQIARELSRASGQVFTRSAVISKVKLLKLPERYTSKPKAQSGPTRKPGMLARAGAPVRLFIGQPRPTRPPVGCDDATDKDIAKSGGLVRRVSNTAWLGNIDAPRKAAHDYYAGAEMSAGDVGAMLAGGSQRCTLDRLTNTTCRWPIGDPHSPDFYFCGGPADLLAKCPYCPLHTKLARGQRR